MIVLWKAKSAVKNFEWVTDHPAECQDTFAADLAKMNRNTLFGRQHSFEKIRSIDDYQKHVPVHDYDALMKYMKLITLGGKDILFPGAPSWWAKTSGTTSNPKLIPIPRDMTRYISDVGSRLLYSFILENPGKNLDTLSGKLLFLRAPSKVGYVNGVPVGYISGISGQTQSRFARQMVVPNRETSELIDWEKKFYRTVLETVGENVTMIAGVTPLLISMFRRMAYDYPERLLHDLKKEAIKKKIQGAFAKRGGRLIPKDCWENLRLYCSSSASIKPYVSTYKELFGDTPVREAYGATEGQFGQEIEEGSGLHLNWDKYLFEFIPFSETCRSQRGKDRLIVSELKVGSTYEVLVTTPFGLYSYRIGDVLRVERKDSYAFTIIGRTKMTLNLFGEKVCEEHTLTAIREAEETTGASIADYSCTTTGPGDVSGAPRYVLCVEFINPPKDKTKFIDAWDRKLQEIAPAYGCFRANDMVLRRPKIVLLAKGTFQEYEERRMKNVSASGQLKFPRIDNAALLLSQLQAPS